MNMRHRFVVRGYETYNNGQFLVHLSYIYLSVTNSLPAVMPHIFDIHIYMKCMKL